jgi:D-glycero-alpha-D-manno-heptose-7-phosphate kinase
VINSDLDIYLINENLTLREALNKIELNHLGLIFGVNDENKVIGVATDGDIRRDLLQGKILEDTISSTINRDFVWVGNNISREFLLKQLDHKIKAIPILNEDRRLMDLVTRDFFPTQSEDEIYIRSKAPVRISFGGGGSDLTHFFINEPGAVINATINIYAHALLKLRKDSTISIFSSDLKKKIEANNLPELLSLKSDFGLIQSTLKTIQPDFGFELILNSDFPMKSGLGGSSVLSAAILGCFNQLRKDKFDSYEIAELAYQAERIYLGVSGGWQDQYATVFGGINFMEFSAGRNQIQPLRIPTDVIRELEENMFLCYTGSNHDSGEVHDNQRKQMGKLDVKNLVKENVKLTYEIREQLLRGKLFQFANSLHKAWELKKNFGEKITNAEFNNLYDFAISNGAIGGKLLGAGGGGYFLFYANPYRKHNLIQALKENGNEVRNFLFEDEGLKTWSIRENMSVY